jgi:L-arabinose isomerase
VEHDLVGGAFNCHGESCLGHPALGVVACLAVSEQTRAGRPFSCTGDLPTAVALVLAKTISGVAIYAELDLVDEPHDAVLLANGGEGDAWVEGAPLELFPNENFRGVRGRGASVRTAIEAAPATLVSFTPVDERATPPRYRLIVAEGQLSASLPAALSGFHAAFRFEGRSADDGFRRWCNAGAPHHLAVARGHCGDAMAVVCEHFGWDHRSITSAPC